MDAIPIPIPIPIPINNNVDPNEIVIFEYKEDTRMNKFNLELLANPLYQKGIVKTEKGGNKNCKTDLKFYRKRILALTTDYIKGNYDRHGASNEALRQLHCEYVYNVIQYLKMTDKVDIIQNDHAIDIADISYVDTGLLPHTSTPTPNTSPNYSFIADPTDLYNDAHLNVKHVNTLDSYIKRTKKVNKSPISLPVNRVINYHVPELKNKGVKENNINKI
jgi:hypothetical protein